MIFAVTVAYCVQLNGSKTWFILYCLLGSCVGYSQVKVASWYCHDGIQAFVVFSIIVAIQVLFSGYVVTRNSTVDWLSWACHLSVVFWGTGLLMENELQEYPQGESILLPYYDYYDETAGVLVLVVTWIVFELLVLYLMWPPSLQLEHIDDKHHLIQDSLDDNHSDPYRYVTLQCVCSYIVSK